MEKLRIDVGESAVRLDKYIADNSEISRSFAAKLAEDGAEIPQHRYINLRTRA